MSEGVRLCVERVYEPNVCPALTLSITAGAIIDTILHEGFDITGAQLFRLTRGEAEEFLEVYKGVVPEYHVRAVCAVCVMSLLL